MANKPFFQPSGLNSHFTDKYHSFSDYVCHMRQVVEQARKDLNDENRERVIDANSPFQWLPPKSQGINPETGKYKNGILLVHGLFDSPFTMVSMAEYFRRKHYLVRVILLPGHGTTPGDLMNMSYQEWEKATTFAINSFTNQVDNLYLCGFSTGAALVLHHTLKVTNPIIKGLILLAPAIRLRTEISILSNIDNLMHKTIGGIKWYTKAATQDYAKYQSFTINSAHQVHLLTKEIQRLHKTKPLQIPCFVVATADDEVLSLTAAAQFFSTTLNPINRCIVYGNNLRSYTDQRIEIRKSAYPSKKIVNFSHICIPIAPNHPHYGINGDFKDFLHYEEGFSDRKDIIEKQGHDALFLGAATRDNLKKYHLQRITYNPDFSHMLKAILQFIGKTRENTSGHSMV